MKTPASSQLMLMLPASIVSMANFVWQAIEAVHSCLHCSVAQRLRHCQRIKMSRFSTSWCCQINKYCKIYLQVPLHPIKGDRNYFATINLVCEQTRAKTKAKQISGIFRGMRWLAFHLISHRRTTQVLGNPYPGYSNPGVTRVRSRAGSGGWF